MRSFVLLEKASEKMRNRTVITTFSIFVIVISFIVYKSALYGFGKLDFGYPKTVGGQEVEYINLRTIKVSCNEHEFRAYVANSTSSRERGLSVFRKIDKKQAMIFVFDTLSKYSFWMKGMRFPIDIVWINQEGKIVDIVSDIEPNTYPKMFTSKDDSMFVLEFNANTASELNIKIGDSCSFENPGVK